MRIGLSIILGLLLTLQSSALPAISKGTLPAWLYSIHPDLNKRPAPDEISEGFYYELLDLQTDLPNKTRYTRYIKDISNETGVQNASEVSVTFAPEFQQVVFHRLTIIRDGAILNRLDLSRIKVIQEENEAGEFEYNGLKRAFIILKDVRKGDRIEVAYSIVGFNPVFGDKFSDDFTFSSPTAICNYYKTILTTADRPLHIATQNNAPAPAEKHLGNTLVYTWENPDLSSVESGPETPSWFDRSPTTYITEYKNWAEVIDWGLKTFNHYHFSLPPALLKKIAAWKVQAKDDKDLFANIATRFVQNEIRYLGLEIGVNTHQPQAPADVFDQRFGDCKDKSLLLAAILQTQGIPAFVALVSTDTRGQLPNIAPSPRDFDHAIVAIRRPKGAYLYIDPTNAGQRGELQDLFIPDYGYALVLEDGATTLQTVTPGRINDFNITEMLDAKAYDSSKFNIISVYSGGAAEDIRSIFQETSLKDIEERYRKYYADIFEGIRLAKPITFNDDSLKNEFTVQEHYTIPQVWNTDKMGKKYFEFSASILENVFPDPEKARVDEPLALDYPHNIQYTLLLSPLDDWDFDDTELHIKNADYQFDFVPASSGNTRSLRYSFRSFHDHIPASAIRQYKEDYQNIIGKISFRITKNGNADSPKQTASGVATTRNWKVCWPAIWLTFFFALFFSRLFTWLNSRTEETLYAPGTGYPLGGWLVLFGASIGISLVVEGVQLLRENYYSHANWTLFGNAGGASLQYLILTELAVRLGFLAGGGAILFWFIKKRDIFPRMFLWYIGILLSSRLLLILLYSVIPVPASFTSYKTDLANNLIRTLIFSAVWVTYILRSGQVKSTFLEPFRERIR
ncbi:MAG TPA: DUF3857 domain-containing protein [Puia sp.]|nr:DUF3857 domain-containing protein [Puia sp.]